VQLMWPSYRAKPGAGHNDVAAFSHRTRLLEGEVMVLGTTSYIVA